MVKILFLHSSILPALRGLLLPVAAGLLFAQPAPEVPPLSLSDAFKKVAASNPELEALRFRSNAAVALIEQAGTRPLPSLDLGLEKFAGTGPRQGVQDLEVTLQASRRIERGDKRAHRIALAESRSIAESRNWSLRRAQLLAQTARAYVDAWAAARRLDLALEEEHLLREALTAAEARVDAGTASPAEVARARAALINAEVETVRAQSKSENTRTALASLWGGRPDVPVLTHTLAFPATLPDASELRARLAQHPRLVLQHSETASHRHALEVERAETKPDLSVSGGVRFISDGSDAALVAGLSWPLGARHQNQGNIRAARENVSGAEYSVRAIESELLSSFHTAWRDLTTSHQIVQTLRQDALPAIEQAHAINTDAYEQGQLAWIEVLFTRQELMATRRRILEAETEFVAAAVRIDDLTTPQFSLTISLLPDS